MTRKLFYEPKPKPPKKRSGKDLEVKIKIKIDLEAYERMLEKDGFTFLGKAKLIDKEIDDWHRIGQPYPAVFEYIPELLEKLMRGP